MKRGGHRLVVSILCIAMSFMVSVGIINHVAYAVETDNSTTTTEQTDNADDAENSEEDTSTETTDDSCEAGFFGFGWLICPGQNLITTIFSHFFNMIADSLEWTFLAENTDVMLDVWQDFHFCPLLPLFVRVSETVFCRIHVTGTGKQISFHIRTFGLQIGQTRCSRSAAYIFFYLPDQETGRINVIRRKASLQCHCQIIVIHQTVITLLHTGYGPCAYLTRNERDRIAYFLKEGIENVHLGRLRRGNRIAPARCGQQQHQQEGNAQQGNHARAERSASVHIHENMSIDSH